MNKKKRWSITLRIMEITYLLIGGLFLFQLSNIPTIYGKMEQQLLYDVKVSINTILVETTEHDQIKNKLEELTKTHALELIVSDDAGMIYTTFDQVDINSIRHIFNNDAVLAKSQGYLDTTHGRYTVMYVVYHITMVEYIEQQFTNFILLIAMLVILLAGMIFVIYIQLIRPLYSLKKGLEQLNAYEFGVLISEVDVITADFNRFSQRMHVKITDVSRKYTELELALEFERERLSIMMAIARGFVHNLKTPIHQTLLENEFVVSQLEKPAKELILLADFNMKRSEKVLLEINEILALMDDDQGEIKNKIEIFDFITTLEKTWGIFKFYVINNELSYFANIPEKLVVHMNKVSAKIILHNLFSNATKYATRGTEITIEIDDTAADFFSIYCTNETTEANINKMKKRGELFFSDEDMSDGGNGLYLLKELTEFIGGSYEFSVDELSVTIKVCLPFSYERREA